MCNENAMIYWALQYGPNVEIIEPKSIREEITNEIDKMYKKYYR